MSQNTVYPIVLRVAARFQRAAGATVDLQTVQITADNAEDVLKALIDDVDNIEEAESRLKLDIRGMLKLLGSLSHNDDLYHNGETVLEHMKWVLEDLDKLSDGKDAATKQVITIAALMHDLGKAYTYEFKGDPGDPKAKPPKPATPPKHTFYQHAVKSVEVAEVLLAKHRERLGDAYSQILDLVRLHDTFLNLAATRLTMGGNVKYLDNFMRESIYTQKRLDHLVTLAKADSNRSKAEAGTLQRIEDVLSDLEKNEALRAEAVARKAREQQNWLDKQPEIRAMLEAGGAAEAAAELPDLAKTMEALGRIKKQNLIPKLRALFQVK